MEEKVLRQLAWIKWLLIGIVTVFLIPVALSSWLMWKTVPSTDLSKFDCAAPQSGGNFQEQAKNFLLQGKEQEVLKLAASREAAFPKDPYVFLYRGRAQFQLREYEKAIATLGVAETLSPDWRDQYITPYVTEAKRQLSIKATAGAAGQNAPPAQTATELYEAQVKKALELQQRTEQLLAVQEDHVKRFGAVLEKWERQTGLKKP